MSDAKKCDRCDEFFTLSPNQYGTYLNGSTPIWLSAHVLRSNPDNLDSYGVQASGVKTRRGKMVTGDLCPKCSQGLMNWWDSGMDKAIQNG